MNQEELIDKACSRRSRERRGLMKWLIFGAGVLTGLAFNRVPHYIDMYAEHSLPDPYEGPKFRRWVNGVEQPRNSEAW